MTQHLQQEYIITEEELKSYDEVLKFLIQYGQYRGCNILTIDICTREIETIRSRKTPAPAAPTIPCTPRESGFYLQGYDDGRKKATIEKATIRNQTLDEIRNAKWVTITAPDLSLARNDIEWMRKCDLLKKIESLRTPSTQEHERK